MSPQQLRSAARRHKTHLPWCRAMVTGYHSTLNLVRHGLGGRGTLIARVAIIVNQPFRNKVYTTSYDHSQCLSEGWLRLLFRSILSFRYESLRLAQFTSG